VAHTPPESGAHGHIADGDGARSGARSRLVGCGRLARIVFRTTGKLTFEGLGTDARLAGQRNSHRGRTEQVADQPGLSTSLLRRRNVRALDLLPQRAIEHQRLD